MGTGIVQTTHYQVGPDHCFMPKETFFFRNNSFRFQKPIWVVAKEEEKAFVDRNLDCLVKDTLKKGDRYLLIPAFDRSYMQRGIKWRYINPYEIVKDVLEGERPRGKGFITQKMAEIFAIKDGGKVKLAHCDCTRLKNQVGCPAIIGAPLNKHEGQDREVWP